MIYRPAKNISRTWIIYLSMHPFHPPPPPPAVNASVLQIQSKGDPQFTYLTHPSVTFAIIPTFRRKYAKNGIDAPFRQNNSNVTSSGHYMRGYSTHLLILCRLAFTAGEGEEDGYSRQSKHIYTRQKEMNDIQQRETTNDLLRNDFTL